MEDLSDSLGDGFVGGEARGNEDEVRAALTGDAGGHGGVDAVLAGFVAGGGDDAPLLGGAADGDRFATVLGEVTLLHGCEEGIHVDMDDFAHGDAMRLEERGLSLFP